MPPCQILKIIIDNEQVITQISQAIEHEGHKVLEVKRLNKTDWEIIIQKREEIYAI